MYEYLISRWYLLKISIRNRWHRKTVNTDEVLENDLFTLFLFDEI